MHLNNIFSLLSYIEFEKIVIFLAMLASGAAAFYAYQNIKALYTLKKSEIDLNLRKERKEYFEEISNILTKIFRDRNGYMREIANNFHLETIKIRTLERKANYSLDKDSKKIFSEIIDYIVNVISKYEKELREHQKELRDVNTFMPSTLEGYDNANALKKLENLENRYLSVENIYPKR